MMLPRKRFASKVIYVTLIFVAAAAPALAQIEPLDEPSVRCAYVIPSNRTPQVDGVANIQETLLLVHDWYGEQMRRWGFGFRSFRYETEADGVTPRIHVIDLSVTDAYIRESMWGECLGAAYEAGVTLWTPGEVWLVVPETHSQLPSGEVIGGVALGTGGGLAWADAVGDAPGVSMMGSDTLMLANAATLDDDTFYHGKVIPTIGPYPLVQDVSWAWFLGTTYSSLASCYFGAAAHEMGHAFGLYHDLRNDQNFHGNLMGNGLRGMRGTVYPDEYTEDFTRLAYAAALSLSVSRYFIESEPRCEIVTGHNYGDRIAAPAVEDRSIAIRTGPTGDDVPLDVPPLPGEREDVIPTVSVLTSGSVAVHDGHVEIAFSAADSGGLAAALLRWNGDAVAEMPLSGTSVTDSFFTPYYDPGESNTYTIGIYDLDGNSRRVDTVVTPIGVENRAPRPFMTMSPVWETYVGQTVSLDATLTHDPDWGDALSFQWVLDDGRRELLDGATLDTSFDTPGDPWIRVRVTDDSGAVTLSTPITLHVWATPLPGDMDCNGDVDFDDIDPFVQALNSPSAYEADHPHCPFTNRDVNGDGVVDFDDIDPFVAALSH